VPASIGVHGNKAATQTADRRLILKQWRDMVFPILSRFQPETFSLRGCICSEKAQPSQFMHGKLTWATELPVFDACFFAGAMLSPTTGF
jgi:hypothetical protein